MTKGNAETETNEAEAITRGTGNVFADLGYADADERQTKLRLAHAAEERHVEMEEIGGHAVERGDRAQRAHIIINAGIAHHAHGLDR